MPISHAYACSRLQMHGRQHWFESPWPRATTTRAASSSVARRVQNTEFCSEAIAKALGGRPKVEGGHEAKKFSLDKPTPQKIMGEARDKKVAMSHRITARKLLPLGMERNCGILSRRASGRSLGCHKHLDDPSLPFPCAAEEESTNSTSHGESGWRRPELQWHWSNRDE